MAPKRRNKVRRRRVRVSEAWRGDSAGHRKAALKGIRRKKAKRAVRRKKRVSAVMESPMKRRSSSRRSRSVMEAPRRRRRRVSEAPRRSSAGSSQAMTMAVAVISGGLGFVLADGLDRFLATYDPSSTEEKPKDKFTSDGAGTLANTLNVASSPGLLRIGAGIGAAAIPAVAAMYVKNPLVRSSLEGAAVGAGISVFKSLWNNFLMPMFVGKDTTTAALQKSYIARLYPAEVAAHINLRKTDDAGAERTPQLAVSSTGSGALSGAPNGAVGNPGDVGPFALSAPEFPTLQNVWGTGQGGNFPTAAQALQQRTGMTGGCGPVAGAIPGWPGVGEAAPSTGVAAAAPAETGVAAWSPGPPSLPGPGPQGLPTTAGPQPPDTSCGCIGDDNPYLGFVGDAQEETLLSI